MSEPVIPDMNLAEPSPAVIAQRKRVELSHAAFSAIGQMHIKAAESEKVAELLRHLDNEYAKECAALDGIIASELLGKSVVVEGGSKISLAETH